jgi:spore germination protein YaaH
MLKNIFDKHGKTRFIMRKTVSFFIILFSLSSLIIAQGLSSKSSRELTKRETLSDKIVFGFLPYWIDSSTLNIRYDLLTHIGVFTYAVSEDGSLTDMRGNSLPWQSIFNLAYQNDVKLIMTLTNFNADDIHIILTDSVSRNNLFNNVMSIIAQNGYNGVIVDFEGLNTGDDQQYEFKNFMKLFREEFDQVYTQLELSAALPVANFGTWDFTGISEYCDYVFVMGYDFYGSWSETTGPSSPLTAKYISITEAFSDANDYKNVSRDKIILGVPYYGNIWETNSDGAYAEVEPYSDTLNTNNWQSHFFYYDIENYNNFEKFFDNTSQTPWMRIQNDDSTWTQVWYDDSTSLALKYDFAIENDLKGIGIWALGYDGKRDELWNLIEDKFWNPSSAADEKTISTDFALYQNYPNPFNPETVIGYNIPVGSKVTLKIYDVLGREVAILINEYQNAGVHYSTFYTHSSALSSGVYFYRLIAGSYSTTRKMMYIK